MIPGDCSGTIPSHQIEFSVEEREQILARVRDVLESGTLALGRQTREFEQAFAKTVGAKWAVAVNSGSSALEIAMRALGVSGHEVLVPSNTNFATGIAAVNAGATIRLYDSAIEATASEIAQRLSRRVKAVVVVHIGGYISQEVLRVKELCDRHGVALIEDAAQAHGTELNGRMAGSFGTVNAFSFVSTKVLTTGEGGMIVTDDEGLANAARQYRNQGYATDLVHHVLHGNSWRMTEFAAGMGLVQLDSLFRRRDHMREIIALYANATSVFPSLHVLRGERGACASGYKCIALASSPEVKQRIAQSLLQAGVRLARGVYDVPLHRQPIFAPFVGPTQTFPQADDFASRHLCLPLWRTMSFAQAGIVAERLAAVLAENAAVPARPAFPDRRGGG
ncbi:MAG: DegT/DnrJ/EryC1/StrS aminotransferase family protein [Planctomycetota bacterium]|nr:DegT/DnrJ/EryC1/StrS aminotransferase family protein [Planctomycetota bacterium]